MRTVFQDLIVRNMIRLFLRCIFFCIFRSFRNRITVSLRNILRARFRQRTETIKNFCRDFSRSQNFFGHRRINLYTSHIQYFQGILPLSNHLCFYAVNAELFFRKVTWGINVLRLEWRTTTGAKIRIKL